MSRCMSRRHRDLAEPHQDSGYVVGFKQCMLTKLKISEVPVDTYQSLRDGA